MLRAILAKATELDFSDRMTAFYHVQEAIGSFDTIEQLPVLDAELTTTPFEMYSTPVLIDLMVRLFYLKSELKNYVVTQNRIWHIVVLERGQHELGDSLDNLL